MPKSLSIRSGLGSVLFWSVISAAFIGPGTVTTCAMAGSRFGLQLLWALTFSTIGTIILQEAAARITIASGLTLGEIITKTYGFQVRWLMFALFGAVALGCAAYQAGNILGAVSGLVLLTGGSPRLITLSIGLLCIVLLWQGSTGLIAKTLGIIVFTMGAAFAYVAISTSTGAVTFTKSLVVPSLPADSLVLVIGLIGTTIVPYNLFLGSGMGQGQSLTEMRWGISVAVLIGGLISMAILVAGTLVTGDFSFQLVAQTLSSQLGSWAGSLFAFGLFAAGFTSCLTAPLAAAITAQSLLGWSASSILYRLVWLTVMGIGLAFGLAGVKPVPVIILAQAANGLLLPIVTIFLLIAVNNKALLAPEYRNSIWQNIGMAVVVIVTAFLGLRNVWLAI
ncbi:divalent metal cation transporter [Spirosoma sp. HMF3257]|uniref:Divalent metal cation transporter n=1 Tax=Spirosoma telluris TaxID=2183553 RepID=A0A327NGV9_9BACT|nr:divalent metal cation transporter [Spirosoma telluris]RAI74621.1 divalent metal cation transporter [Spirosoma telluris]